VPATLGSVVNRNEIYVVALLLVLIGSLSLFQTSLTGLIITEKTFTTEINQEITATTLTTTEIPLTLEAAPKSVTINGKLIGEGSARVYLQIDEERYLILNSTQLQPSPILTITGRAVDDTQQVQEAANATTVNQTTTVTLNDTTTNTTNTTTPDTPQQTNETVNETTPVALPEINKTINISLEYQSSTAFDTDNNGIETEEGAIDYTVAATEYNWQVDETNLCTRWKIDNLATGTSTIICNGNTECCSLVQLTPSATDWNEPLYITYGAYDSSNNNNISAQVIYANLNLNTTNPIDVTYSKWQSLPATFLQITEFNNHCQQTCTLPTLTFNQKTLQ